MSASKLLLADRIFIRQGEIYLTNRPVWVATILGSCVGTIFYHRPSGLGALSHAMYPEPGSGILPKLPAPFYVDLALGIMQQRFLQHGIASGDIEAYVFGGGVMQGLQGYPDASRNPIGQDNYHVALATIRKLGIKVKHDENTLISGQRLVLDLISHCIILEYLRNDEEESEWTEKSRF
jgi:chemotaxis receptor (MCP) glutamine deamidase CheD